MNRKFARFKSHFLYNIIFGLINFHFRLFTIDKEVWKIPTISAMKTLLDNYEQDTTVNEHVTPQVYNNNNKFT